jgi:hypothetical protein
MGDVHSRTVTQGQIADILQARGSSTRRWRCIEAACWSCNNSKVMAMQGLSEEAQSVLDGAEAAYRILGDE